jgi:hypothetical protein
MNASKLSRGFPMRKKRMHNGTQSFEKVGHMFNNRSSGQ